MKIIYCLASTCFPGGMEKIVTQKANWFAEKGHDVTIVTTEQKKRDNYFNMDARIKRIDLDINYSDTIGVNLIKRFFCRRRKIKEHERELYKIINRECPDIVISTFGNEVSFLPDIVKSGKTVLEIHFSRWFRLQAQVGILHHFANRILTRKDMSYVKKFDAFVCLTKEDERNWGNMRNLHVIPNFTDIIPLEKQIHTKRAIAIGRLTYQKGYDRMIKAWKIIAERYCDWRLDIFGEGEEKETLQKLIRDLDLEESIYINSPTKEVNKEFARSDLLLLTSNFEGLPMVLLEALRCGVPLISFNCQCGPTDVVNESNGILVKNGDIEDFASALSTVMGDTALLDNLTKGAYKSGRLYTPIRVMLLWETLFTQLISHENHIN